MNESSGFQQEKLLGKYQVLEQIGTGGMAEVYKGRHEKLGRDVAIKVMHTSLAGDTQFVARFEREARLAASLRHPGIVQVYDFDKQDDRLFLIMELVNGGTLKQRLEALSGSGQCMPLNEAARILNQLASALDYAHKQGMLHRDLKPANILLDQSGDAFITDFGIARLLESDEITHTGSILGTPNYMSPEQCEGKPLSVASDIYSLGIILFQMLAGEIPFEAGSPLATLQKHIHEPVPCLTDIRPDLPAAVNRLLERALAKQPEARFSSATELARDFSKIIDSSQVEEPSAQQVVPEKESQPAGKPRKTIFWIMAILAVVIVVAAGFFVWKIRQNNLTGNTRCTTVKACETNAQMLSTASRPILALEAYQRAVSLVPPEDQVNHAQLPCDLGDAYTRVNKKPEARIAYKECIAWTHEADNLADLRQYAQKRIKELK